MGGEFLVVRVVRLFRVVPGKLLGMIVLMAVPVPPQGRQGKRHPSARRHGAIAAVAGQARAGRLVVYNRY